MGVRVNPPFRARFPGGATFSIVCPRRPTGLLKTEASNNAKDGTSAARGTYPRGPPFPLSPVPTGPLLLCVFALNSAGDRVSGWRMKTMMFTSAGKSASVCAICGFFVWVAIWVNLGDLWTFFASLRLRDFAFSWDGCDGSALSASSAGSLCAFAPWRLCVEFPAACQRSPWRNMRTFSGVMGASKKASRSGR